MQVSYPILGLGQAQDLVAICGGGGSARTGVKNTVDVYACPTASNGYQLLGSVDTGTELASGLAISPDSTLLAVSINAACWLYGIKYDGAKATSGKGSSTPFEIELLVKIRTDFAANEAGQSSVCFVGNRMMLTGGDDSVVRTWAIDLNANTKNQESSPALAGAPDMTPNIGDVVVGKNMQVTLVAEFKGHTKRIKQIHVDPFSRHLVVSSDEAASCHIWWLHEQQAICFSMSQEKALEESFKQFPKSRPPVPKGMKSAICKHQFRCVRFAPNGQFLITVLSPPRGDAFLIKWVPSTTSQIDSSSWPWTIAAIAVAGNEPVGSCCISNDGQIVATATASGEIQTFSSQNLAKVVRRKQPEEHTFAVTGMAFVPTDNSTAYRMCTAGADKRLLIHTVESTLAASSITLSSLLSTSVRFLISSGFGGVVGAIVFLVGLVYSHASYPSEILLDHPLRGWYDVLAYELQTPDANATLLAISIASIAAIVSLWVCMKTSVVHGLFFNGLALFGLSITSLYIAVEPGMAVNWSLDHVSLSSDLLEYKLAIVSGIACVLVLIAHAFLVLLLRP
ncbi:hypothetical protein THRCLA_06699 [Thraustotheca clavata]|uniref:Uncharacterized protein n=1 Tax=Thraustotheca clavata TaxID=74557 RepID=A0A1V9ZKN0_9STRA|nr:hypothetical protein THRCLA_06699 [Thraustotheca clavata]